MTTSPEPVVPPITSEERAARLMSGGERWQRRIGADASAGELTYKVSAVGVGSMASRITVGNHVLYADQHALLAGDDVGPSPLDYVLAGMASCQVVVFRMYGQAMGITVEDVSAEIDGTLDVRKLLGMDESIRPGFEKVNVTVTVTGPEAPERYQELGEAVATHCPVSDLFMNPTPVSVTVRKG